MTLLEVYDVLCTDEPDPLVILTGFLQIARSVNQGEAATLEGVEASVLKFIEHFGPVTHLSVEEYVTGHGPEFLNIDIPNELIMEFMSGD